MKAGSPINRAYTGLHGNGELLIQGITMSVDGLQWYRKELSHIEVDRSSIV